MTRDLVLKRGHIAIVQLVHVRVDLVVRSWICRAGALLRSFVLDYTRCGSMLDGVARRIGDPGHANGPRYLGELVILHHGGLYVDELFVAYIFSRYRYFL